MELEPIQVSQSNPQEVPQSPELEHSQKIKLNLKYLPSGEVSIESEGITQEQSKDFTDFILTINADNILRQRATQQVCKDSSEIFNHLIAFVVCSAITLFGIYTISRILQPQPRTSYQIQRMIYGDNRHIIRNG
jgi:hypothetical protein